MSEFTHDELVSKASKWLKSYGCSVVICELVAFTHSGEVPDAIGWKGGQSILLECKTSRSDFLADKKKHFRRIPELGMGNYRAIFCQDGLINESELPEGWGLLTVSANRKTVRKVRFAKGNTLPPINRFKAFYQAEIALLVSQLRRNEVITREYESQISVADSLIRKLENSLELKTDAEIQRLRDRVEKLEDERIEILGFLGEASDLIGYIATKYPDIRVPKEYQETFMAALTPKPEGGELKLKYLGTFPVKIGEIKKMDGPIVDEPEGRKKKEARPISWETDGSVKENCITPCPFGGRGRVGSAVCQECANFQGFEDVGYTGPVLCTGTVKEKE